MCAAFSKFVDVVAQGVSFGEEDFGEVLRLDHVSQVRYAKYLRALIRTLVSDDRSSHWTALLMFAKAKMPSGLRSVKRRWRASCGITLETKEELLFTMLFFGFRFLDESLLSLPFTIGASAGFPSPKVGVKGGEEAENTLLLKVEPFSLAGLWVASSCMLGGTAERVLVAVVTRNKV